MTNILVKLQQYFCKHKWRPALQSVREEIIVQGLPEIKETEKQLKVCLYCMKKVFLTDAEMYCEFGIVNFIGR